MTPMPPDTTAEIPATATEIAAAVRSGALSATDVTAAALGRIAARDDRVGFPAGARGESRG